MIEWIAIDDGTRWRYDYTAFDTYVESLGEWGIDQQINAFSIAGWNAGTITYRDEGSNDKKVLRTGGGIEVLHADLGCVPQRFQKAPRRTGLVW